MRYLGPLSSTPNSSRLLYVDLSLQLLDTSENLQTIYSITSSDADVIITNITIPVVNATTTDGHLLVAGKYIAFKASCSVSKTCLVTLTIDYLSTLNNRDSTCVFLKVVPSI